MISSVALCAFLRRSGLFFLTVLLTSLLAGCYRLPEVELLQARGALSKRQSVLDAPAVDHDLVKKGSVTPFQPQQFTPTPIPEVVVNSVSIPDSMSPTAQIAPAPDPRYQLEDQSENRTLDSGDSPQSNSAYSPEPALDFHGIDFASDERVTILIYPPEQSINNGKPVKISFIPGNHCRFGDKKGCVYAYKPNISGNVIVITVHSGVGGEAQRLRAALEGTGINRAAYNLKKVQSNMAALSGAQVVIKQGDRETAALRVAAITRIPARSLVRYFRAPLAEILAVAADINPEVSDLVYPAGPQIVIETCGWKMPGEPGSEKVTDTTGSIYLGIIH